MGKINPHTESAIVADYLAGDSAPVVAERRGVYTQTVYNVLRRRNVPRRSAKYDVDDEYFRVIDAEAKAYWLGFIAADGCVSRHKKGFVFSMSLALRDLAHMESFRAALGYTGRISFGSSKSPSSDKVNPLCRIGISRTRLCEHLVAHGIAPRKSWCLVPPIKYVPADLLRHYWRGHVDGDGWISSTATKNSPERQWMIGLCGTKAVVEGFAEFVKDRTGIVMTPSKNRNVWRVQTGGIQYPQLITRALYDGSTVHLARKKTLADQMLASVPRQARALLVAGKVVMANEAAESLGLNRNTITRRIKDGMSVEEATTRPNMIYRHLTCNGETLAIHEWCKRLSIAETTILNRLKRGDSPERALRPVDPRNDPEDFGPITLHGETLTVPQWAKRLGLNVTTIYFRLHKGEKPEQVLRPVGKVSYRGEWLSISELARRKNLNRTTLRYRLKQGQSPEEAARPLVRT